MNDYYTVISVNTLKKDFKGKESNEIPPLPAFKTQSNVEVVQLPSDKEYNNTQNIVLFCVSIIFWLILIYLIVKRVVNDDDNFSVSGLLAKNVENANENKFDNKIETESESVEVLTEASSGLLKLATPKSLEKCIKSFLEITQEK